MRREEGECIQCVRVFAFCVKRQNVLLFESVRGFGILEVISCVYFEFWFVFYCFFYDGKGVIILMRSRIGLLNGYAHQFVYFFIF